VRTDCLTEEEAAAEVIRGWNYLRRGMIHHAHEQDTAAVVATATESYPIFIGWGIMDTIGQRMKGAGLSGSAYVISEDRVFPLYARECSNRSGTPGSLQIPSLSPQGEKQITGGCLHDLQLPGAAPRGARAYHCGAGGRVMGTWPDLHPPLS